MMPSIQSNPHDGVKESDDRRVASRYKLQIPIEILFEDGSRLSVLTRDISASGAFVKVVGNRQLDNHSRFIITFPKEITTSGKLLALCDGAVVRRESASDSEGVAIKIVRYYFLQSAA